MSYALVDQDFERLRWDFLKTILWLVIKLRLVLRTTALPWTYPDEPGRDPWHESHPQVLCRRQSAENWRNWGFQEETPGKRGLLLVVQLQWRPVNRAKAWARIPAARAKTWRRRWWSNLRSAGTTCVTWRSQSDLWATPSKCPCYPQPFSWPFSGLEGLDFFFVVDLEPWSGNGPED